MDISLRPIKPPDLAAVHALQLRVERGDGIPIATPLDEFEEWLDDPHLSLEHDTRLVAVSGAIAGWGRIWHRPSGVREERAYVFGGVDPAFRGRGLGSQLLAWQLERSRALLATTTPSLPRFVRAQAYDFEATRLRLFARHGMRIVRYMDELLMPLGVLPTAADPAGVSIVPWASEYSEAARLAQNEAFADHWGSTPRDPAAWAHELAGHGIRLDLSWLALDGDRVVGVCRNAHFPSDEAVTGRREGWVENVSTVRSHRARGIATALVSRSLGAFAAAGLTHAALGVDSESITGAYAIYERLGFRPVRRTQVFEIEG